MLLSTAIALVFTAMTSAYAEEGTEKTDVYIIPDDVKCVVRKKDKVTYCTDKKGTPITGEIHKYRENTLIRLYPQKEGLLHGIARSWFLSGNLLSEKPYRNGKIDGVAKTWYEEGGLESETPYINGVREGVVKYYHTNGVMMGQGIYIENKLNGPARLYNSLGEIVYDINYQDDNIVSGKCKYYAPNTTNVVEVSMDDELINAVNNNKKYLLPKIGEGECAFE